MTVVLVTGASSGFGRLVVEEVAAAGHRVFGTSRRPDAHPDLPGLLPLEVTDPDSARACVRAVLDQAGRLDVLVNNAGTGLAGALEDTSVEEARRQLDTNVGGVVALTAAALPVMREQGSGRVITVSSMAGLVGLPYQSVYAASKHAVEGLVSSLRLELVGSGIDACTVAPGDFPTGFTDARTVAARARTGAHAERFARVLARYEHDERTGPDPRLVARLVARLVDARRLRRRYLVGSSAQRAQVAVARLLPTGMVERAMRVAYDLDG